jgi:carbonic anhydrase
MKRKRYGKALLLGLSMTAILALAPVVYGSGGGGHGSEAPAAKSMNPTETIKAAIAGNDQFKGHHDSSYFEAYQKGQTPNLTVITCADSRVHTPLFGMDPHNNIFIIRNVGNQIVNSEGSVDYGVHHLPTKILLVMGHSSCGAVKAAMGDYSGETKGIKAELDTLAPVIAVNTGEGDVARRWAENVEINVDHQVNYALNLYHDQVGSGQMAVVGGVYDFNDNYGKGRGTLVITNVNGEIDPNRIMNHAVLKDLAKSEIVNHVSSLAPAASQSEPQSEPQSELQPESH